MINGTKAVKHQNAQTNKERIEMMYFTREIINKRVLLMVGTGATRTEDCVMFTKAAKAAGADFLLVKSSVCGAD